MDDLRGNISTEQYLNSILSILDPSYKNITTSQVFYIVLPDNETTNSTTNTTTNETTNSTTNETTNSTTKTVIMNKKNIGDAVLEGIEQALGSGTVQESSSSSSKVDVTVILGRDYN